MLLRSSIVVDLLLQGREVLLRGHRLLNSLRMANGIKIHHLLLYNIIQTQHTSPVDYGREPTRS